MHTRNAMPTLLIVAFLLSGCSNFSEQYLFRAGRPGRANYYRVKIEGYTKFSSSQFAAGLYDAEAVDALFGELSGAGKRVSVTSGFQQTPATTTAATSSQMTIVATTTSSTSGNGANASNATTLTGESLRDQKFVFFLSSNANAFVNQIQTYVNADRLQSAVMTLIFKDDLSKLETSRAETVAADLRAKALGDAMTRAATSLGTGETAKSGEVRTATLAILAQLASRSNSASPPTFATIAAAETWLREHPRAFRTNGGQQ